MIKVQASILILTGRGIRSSAFRNRELDFPEVGWSMSREEEPRWPRCTEIAVTDRRTRSISVFVFAISSSAYLCDVTSSSP